MEAGLTIAPICVTSCIAKLFCTLLNDRLTNLFNPIKPRVFDALGRLGGADSAPLFYFCSVQHRAMKLGMCIVHHEMNPKMQSIFSYDT